MVIMIVEGRSIHQRDAFMLREIAGCKLTASGFAPTNSEIGAARTDLPDRQDPPKCGTHSLPALP